METLLYETYKLIELNETQINGAWKGAHLLLFFLAFVFGSFCTFCFHMLMYFFEEKCVLYPKLLSLSNVKQNVIKEILPYDSEELDSLPVDFVSTQWVEQSVCYLPTYVPLVSGICGLVWSTLFLMCSTGSRVFTGLQQSWRILPPVLVFSLVLGSLCVYTSAVTTRGLRELCSELADITGDTTCSFAVNVATLPYERRICGVYQAVQLTVLTAWLHTLCWLLSALLAAARVLLAVDFQLVRTSAHLRGNIELILEEHEQQVETVGYVTDRQRRRRAADDFTRRSINEHGSSYLRTVPRDQRFIVRTVFNLVNNAVTLAEFLRKNKAGRNPTRDDLTETYEYLAEVENIKSSEDDEILRAIKTHDDEEMDASVYVPINDEQSESLESVSDATVLSSVTHISGNEQQRKQKREYNDRHGSLRL